MSWALTVYKKKKKACEMLRRPREIKYCLPSWEKCHHTARAWGRRSDSNRHCTKTNPAKVTGLTQQVETRVGLPEVTRPTPSMLQTPKPQPTESCQFGVKRKLTSPHETPPRLPIAPRAERSGSVCEGSTTCPSPAMPFEESLLEDSR